MVAPHIKLGVCPRARRLGLCAPGGDAPIDPQTRRPIPTAVCPNPMPAFVKLRILALAVLGTLCAGIGRAQGNRIDVVTPYAPELASYGTYAVGVRTLTATDPNRIDVAAAKEGSVPPRYDRVLTLEVWYPAALASGQSPGGDYSIMTRDPSVTAVIHGRAVRDAAPLRASGGFPLVILSHGFPGNRYLLSHLGENLASKGFVTVSIDHKDSTYGDVLSFSSTLYNRPLDQLFVLNAVAKLGEPASGSFLAGMVDASRTGIVGYSMGGYGVVNTIGGGFSQASVSVRGAPPNRLLADHAADNPSYQARRDSRIKAAIAVAPWGRAVGVWDAEGLKGIKVPVLFVAGSADVTAGYEKGTRQIFREAVNSDRYLLTFVNAGHNAAAPMPAPFETYQYSETLKMTPFVHYADPIWDSVRMNNILAHFATAFFDLNLKGEADKRAYLDLTPSTGDLDASWKGFKPHTELGLILEHAPVGK